MAIIQESSKEVDNTSEKHPNNKVVDVTNEKVPPELPELTLSNVLDDIKQGIIAFLINPKVTIIVYPIIICLSSIITKLVINKIPYTEIDFITYMQQIELINNKGIIKYSEIKGDSGPIVYPGGFVQIYQFIQWLISSSTTENGGGGELVLSFDIREAQYIFSYLFTISIIFNCLIYINLINIPPWTIYLFLLSKRLISIYVLRLFNDCWTTLSILGVILILQQAAAATTSTTENWLRYLLVLLAGDLYSIAISIKMNALLYFPGFIIIIYFLLDENLMKSISVLIVMIFIQIIMGWQFLLPLEIFNKNDEIKKMASIIRWDYINNAFNFKRKFLYEWTINWKFLSIEIFSSNGFAKLLLLLHGFILLIFIFTRFLNSRIIGGKSITNLIYQILFSSPFSSHHHQNSNLIKNPQSGPQLIFIIMSITNLIGVLFSRSLHYQFLSWYAWSLPGLLYLNFPIYLALPIWFIHEWCWNVFPSNSISSSILVGILSLIIGATWWNFDYWFPPTINSLSTTSNETNINKNKQE
ncbi:Dol-P-Man-dependent alpha(1-3)-mannosyltransferase, putative [Candida dubliniensis CD36]|uniref:Dol-P-Man:Man(5)GlcNAc(2)-PP-Dol alpha-1,3-mannosyltransferase n=1 Tax=Candida dubliniensis (strain CD36 / ATCC MYA-646 / CBS 7987 / NCPF 3949 / NRRL Y-17841) TaxID=573826 RepID=B9WJB1_CANDC|nr:Dol-P-Man-dependent alpha(1-3)-mannosyltransferase, putative [Candida dubliniensis CD36]CAX41333.1 Dol-P-Man-dependent alpha(1-3)-mannosyltransferase, putative [Candida dubliniensis CD36]